MRSRNLLIAALAALLLAAAAASLMSQTLVGPASPYRRPGQGGAAPPNTPAQQFPPTSSQIALDAFVSTSGTGNLSVLYSPATYTIRGVVCYVVQNIGTTAEVTGITYGSKSLTEVTPKSPVVLDAGVTAAGEFGRVSGYVLLANVDPGGQTITVAVNATGSEKRVGCFGLSSPTATLAVGDSESVRGDQTDPTFNPSLAWVGKRGLVTMALFSGRDSLADVGTLYGNWTVNGEFAFTPAASITEFHSFNTITTFGANVGWGQPGLAGVAGLTIALIEQ